jgi:hypothetical protein
VSEVTDPSNDLSTSDAGSSTRNAEIVTSSNDSVPTQVDERTTKIVIKDDPGINTSEVSRFLGMTLGDIPGYIEVCAFVEGKRTPQPYFFRMGREYVDDNGTERTVNKELIADFVAVGDRQGLLSRNVSDVEHHKVDAWYVRMTTLAHVGPELCGGRGGAKNIRSVIGFWLDGDFGTKGHKKDAKKLPNPPDERSVRQVWAEAGYPEPSVTWMTGGGINGLWLFDEPIIIPDGPEGIDLFNRVQRASDRWQHGAVQAAKKHGWSHDSVGNLDRLMRLPGSVNRKSDHAYDPKAVYADYTGATYTLDELASLLPEEPQKSYQTSAQGFEGQVDGNTPWDAYNAHMWADGRFRQQLADDGWTHHSWAGPVENLTRPDKEIKDGQSGTFGHNEDEGRPKIFPFSDSAPGLLGVTRDEGGFHRQYVDPYQYLAATRFCVNETTGEMLTGREALSLCARYLRSEGFGRGTEKETVMEAPVPGQRIEELPPVPSSSPSEDSTEDYVLGGQMALNDELARRQAIITANQIEAAKALKDPTYRPSWEVRAYEQILGREQAQKRRAEELRVEEPEDDFGDIFDLIEAGDTTDRRPMFGYLADDSCGLFYEGTTNGIYGKSGIGKSIIQARLQVEAMRNGKNVLHWEFDNNANPMIIRRLVDAGVTRDQLVNQFRVVRSVEELERKVGDDFTANVGLVTLDALTPAISALGGEVNHPSGTDLVLRTLMQPFTVRGAVGFFLGHVGHENQDRMAGSNRMFAAMQGALYNAEVVVKPTIGVKGLVKLVLKKDNQGYAGEGDKLAAYVTYDSTSGDGKVNTIFSRERSSIDLQGEIDSLETEKTDKAERTMDEEIRTIWKALSKADAAMSANDLYVLLQDRTDSMPEKRIRARLDKMLKDGLAFVDTTANQLPASSSGGKPPKRFRAAVAPGMTTDS